MSLENIQGKMSRNEMRNIMAGSITFYRTNVSSSDYFSSDSSAAMGTWSGFRTSAGWYVQCNNGFHNKTNCFISNAQRILFYTMQSIKKKGFS